MLEYALSLHYQNKSIPDVLAMNIEEAAIYSHKKPAQLKSEEPIRFFRISPGDILYIS